MDSRPESQQYAPAWAEYNRRWFAAWLIPLALLLCYLASAVDTSGHPKTWILVVAFGVYAALYLRFIRWRCPRCGRRFTTPDPYSMRRSKACRYCGLQREAGPESERQIHSR